MTVLIVTICLCLSMAAGIAWIARQLQIERLPLLEQESARLGGIVAQAGHEMFELETSATAGIIDLMLAGSAGVDVDGVDQR